MWEDGKETYGCGVEEGICRCMFCGWVGVEEEEEERKKRKTHPIRSKERKVGKANTKLMPASQENARDHDAGKKANT